MNILTNISSQRICDMQQKIIQVYDQYIKDSNGRLRAILDVVDHSPYDYLQNIAPE